MAYTFQATTFSPSGFVSHKISKTKLITNYNDKMLLPITKIFLSTCNLRQIYQQITTAINHKFMTIRLQITTEQDVMQEGQYKPHLKCPHRC